MGGWDLVWDAVEISGWGEVWSTFTMLSLRDDSHHKNDEFSELDRVNCADSAFIICRTDAELMKN